MFGRRFPVVGLVVGMVIASMAVAACGSSSSSESSSKASSGGSSSGGSGGSSGGKGSIPIGFTGDLSGDFAATGGGWLEGLQAQFNTVNASGGIDGKKINLIARDDQAAESRLLANETQLIHEDNVHLLTGVVSGDLCTAAQTQAVAASVPMLCGSAGVSQVEPPSPNPWVFMPAGAFPAEASAAMALAKQVVRTPKARVAIVAYGVSSILDYVKTLKQLATQNGWSVVSVQTVPLTATSSTAQADAIAAAKPDVVFPSLGPLSVPLVKDLRQSGFTGPVIENSTGTTNPNTADLKDPNYYALSQVYPPNNSAAYQAYASAMKAIGKNPDNGAAEFGWVMGSIISAALKQCNDCSGSQLAQTLSKLSVKTNGVGVGDVAFDPGDHEGLREEAGVHWDATTQSVTVFADHLPTQAP